MILKRLLKIFIRKINFSWSLVSILLITLSINVNPTFITNNISNNLFALNFIRFFSASIFTILIIIYFKFFKKKIFVLYSKNFLKNNIEILLLFSIFIIFFLFSLLNFNLNLQILYFINYFNSFVFIYLISNSKKNMILQNLIYFISITFFIYLLLILYEIVNDPLILTNLYKAKILQFDTRILNEATPRSTGAAKGILIFTLLIFFNFIIKNNQILKLIIMFLLGFIIFSLFSRTTLIFYIFLNIFYFLLIKKNYNLKIIFIIFSLFFPAIFFNIFSTQYSNSSIKNYIYKNENYNFKNENYNFKNENYNFKNEKKYEVTKEINNSSSGRILIWYKILKNKGNIYIGDGILADHSQFNESASNGLIYTYLCGGFFAFILLVIFKIIVIKKIFISISKKIKHNYLPSMIILFLFFRFLFENGYVVYLYELFLLLLSLIYLNKNLRRKFNSIRRPIIYNKQK